MSGLSPAISDDEFLAAFEKFGEVISHNIVKDHVTKQSREFGFIKFADRETSEIAIREMNDTVLAGKQIRVELSRRGEPRRQTPGRYMGVSRYSGDDREERDWRQGRDDRERRDYSRRRVDNSDDDDSRYRRREYDSGRDRREYRNSDRDRYADRGREESDKYRERSRDVVKGDEVDKYRNRDRDYRSYRPSRNSEFGREERGQRSGRLPDIDAKSDS